VPALARAAEATGWAVAVTWTALVNLGDTWRNATARERWDLTSAAALTGWLALAQFVWDLPWYAWGLVLVMLTITLGDLQRVALTIAERRKLARVLQAQPTGAPRMATVRCAAGLTHRFLYGPDGWEDAGWAAKDDRTART
jgi:hypothetical protein